MSLVIDLPSHIEIRLHIEATKAGISTTNYAADLLAKSLPVQTIDTVEQKRLDAASITLLKSWLERSQDTASPEQQVISEADLTEFMQNMNSTRKSAGKRLLYPDTAVQSNEDEGKV